MSSPKLFIILYLFSLLMLQCDKSLPVIPPDFPPVPSYNEEVEGVTVEIASNISGYHTKFAVHREKRLLASVDRYTIAIWDIDLNKQTQEFEKTEWGKPERIAFSADGQELRIWTDHNEFIVWNLLEGKQSRKLECIYNTSRENRYLLAIYSMGVSSILDIEEGDTFDVEMSCGKKATVFSDNSRYFAHVNRCDSIIRVYDLHRGELLHQIIHDPNYRTFSLGNTGSVIAFQKDKNWRINVLGIDSTKLHHQVKTLDLERGAMKMKFTENDNYLCINTFDDKVKILNTRTGRIALNVPGGANEMSFVIDSSYILYYSTKDQERVLLDQKSLRPVDNAPLIHTSKGLTSNDGLVFYQEEKPLKNRLYLFDFYDQVQDTIDLSLLAKLFVSPKTEFDHILQVNKIAIDLRTLELLTWEKLAEQHGVIVDRFNRFSRQYSPRFKYYHTEEGVYDSSNNKLVFSFTGESISPINRRMQYSIADRILLTYNSRSKKFQVIDLETKNVLRETSYDYDRKYKLADSGAFYFTYDGKNLRKLRAHSLSKIVTSPKWQGKFYEYSQTGQLAISPDEKYVAFFVTKLKEKVLTIWSLETGELINQQEFASSMMGDERFSSVAFVPNTDEVIIYVSGKTFELRNFLTNEMIWQKYPSGEPGSIEVAKSGRVFFQSKGDKYVMHETRSGQEIWEFGIIDNCRTCFFFKSVSHPILKLSSLHFAGQFYLLDTSDWSVSEIPVDSTLDSSNYLARITDFYLSKSDTLKTIRQ